MADPSQPVSLDAPGVHCALGTIGTQRRATSIGFVAVLMWALLALFTAATGEVPPFQLAAMTFAIAFSLALTKWLVRGEDISAHLRQRPLVWAVGVGGLFGYHFFYFLALRNAPAVEASLIAYLWPLLIVVLSALLPGERLRWWHLAGALAGLAGRSSPQPASMSSSTGMTRPIRRARHANTIRCFVPPMDGDPRSELTSRGPSIRTSIAPS